MNFPSKKTMAMLRHRYPAGTLVVLEQMDDPYTRLRPGDRGKVEFVDDAGGIHIAWSNGEGIAAIWGKDCIRKVEEV